MANVDLALASKLNTNAQDIMGIYTTRNQEFDEYEKMFLLKWDYPAMDDLTKITTSSTARDKVLNAMRLLMSQDPVFYIDSQTADEETKDRMEKMLSRWWSQAGRISRRPLHYDMLLSSMLFDEMHTAVTPLVSYQDAQKKGKGKEYAPDPRIERAMKITPVLFQSWNPRNGYPLFDELGLCAYYRKTEDNWASVRNKYAALLDETQTNKNNTQNTDVEIYYDLQHYAVWVDGTPILTEEHGLSAIPIDVTISNGSNFFEDQEDRRQPLLFSLLRSKLWERENLLLTIMYSQMFSIGMAPIMVYKTGSGDQLELDYSNGFGTANIKTGDSLEIISNKGVLPTEMQNVMAETKDAIDRASIQNVAFGERQEGSGTFSETSLLSQSARLPLIASQRLGGFGISSVVELAIMLMKDKGINYDQNGITIKGKDIPDDMSVQVKIDTVLPQERLMTINQAISMKNAQLGSDEYIMSNIIGINDVTGEKRKMLLEQMYTALAQQKIQEKLTALQYAEQSTEAERQQKLQGAVQAGQQAMAGAQQPQQPQQAAPQMPANQQLEAELMSQLESGQPAQTMDMSGGLPGVQGGAIPGMGLAGTADENGVMQ